MTLSSPRLTLVVLAAAASAACRATPAPDACRESCAPTLSGVADPRVAAVVAGSFTDRARASESLVAAGEPALVPLGEARDRASDAPSLERARLDAVINEVLRQAPDDRLVTTHLVARSSSIRRAAAQESARRSLLNAVPALIARLDDESDGVRAASLAALCQLSSRFYDVSPRPSRAEAAAAAARVREWWQREGASRAARSRASGG